MAAVGHVIREEMSGETFPCGDTETVLAAAMRSGRRVILVGCRNGGCGLCKIRVLQGDYRTGKMSRAHVSERDEHDGYALACRTTPLTPLKIEACRPIGGAPTSLTDNAARGAAK